MNTISHTHNCHIRFADLASKKFFTNYISGLRRTRLAGWSSQFLSAPLIAGIFEVCGPDRLCPTGLATQSPRCPGLGGLSGGYLLAGAIGGCSSSDESSPSTASKSLASRKLRYTEANRT
jgi:hypothetical protein